MSLPPKVVSKPAAVAVSGPVTGPSPSSQLRASLTSVSLPPGAPTAQPPAVPPPQIVLNTARARIQRVQPGLDERLFSAQPGVAAVYSVPRHPGPPFPPHDLSKGHPSLQGPPGPGGPASTPGLSQVSVPAAPPYRYLKGWEAGGGSPYTSGQNAGSAPLVYSPQTQPMNVQPQSRPFVTGPRPPPPHQGGFRPIQFLHRAQMQTTRPSLANSNASMRPGSQTAPAQAVYPPNHQPIMMTMTMPFAAPQAAQYYIPQYRHSSPYVAPPQQYSVQPPPGSGTFYPGPGPGEYPAPFATPPYYTGQPVYPPSPPIIVPTPPQQQQQQQQQQPLPAKREKKPIRIRDPNQGGRDITEEIMSGRTSTTPTPPGGRSSATPTPPQQPMSSQTPDPSASHMAACGLDSSLRQPSPASTDGQSTPDKPKPDPTPPPPTTPSPIPALPEASVDPIQREAASSSESANKPPSSSTSIAPSPPLPTAPTVAPTAPVEPVGPKPAPVAPAAPAPAPAPAPGPEVSEESRQEPVVAPTHGAPASSLSTPSPPPQAVNGLADSPAASPCAEVELRVVEEDEVEEEVVTAEAEVVSVQPVAPTPPHRDEPQEPAPTPLIASESPCPAEAPVLIAATSVTPSSSSSSSSSLSSSLSASCPASTPSVLAPPPGLPPLVPPPALGETQGSEAAVVVPDVTDAPTAHKPDASATLAPAATEDAHKQSNSRKTSATAPVQSTTPAPKSWKKPNEGSHMGEAPSEEKEEGPVREPAPPARALLPGPESRGSPPPASADPQDLRESRPPQAPPMPEENGQPEPEPMRNGAAHVSETESSDGGVAPGDQNAGSPVAPAYLFQEELVQANGKRQYNRDFLLGFQFMPACVQKPEGLPQISDVVLDKINQNKLPSRAPDPRVISRGPDFTPAFADFGRPITGGRGAPLLGVCPRRPQPRKIITHISVNDDVQLKKAENAWKPGMKREMPAASNDPDTVKTQELFRKVRSILNKLTPQMFNQLMKQVSELTIDTEERLKGVIDLVFEKAIDEPSFSVAYANMCRCLATLKVPMTDKPNTTVNFRKLLLNRCQKEFERDKVDDVVFERKQKELDSATSSTERERLQEELEEAKDKARRRSIGNIRFIGELFKLKMLTEAIMHDCVVKLLKNHDEESLECLCRLLTTIGKDLDFEKAKPRMDQYFNQMEKIVKERKTSSRIRFMLQDIIDLRLHNWVSRRADQGPKTIEQIHKEAKIEEQEEQRKVHQQLLNKDSKRRPDQREVRPQREERSQREESWSTVPMSKNSRTIDPAKIPKISKPQIDDKIQLGPRAQLNWMKGSSGGAKASDSELSRSTGSSLNRYSALQQSSTAPPSPQANQSADYDSRRTLGSRGSIGRERGEKPQAPAVRLGPLSRAGSSKDLQEGAASEEPRREGPDTPVVQSPAQNQSRRASTDDRSDTDRNRTTRGPVKAETPPAVVPAKPALPEDEMERKSRAIIDEFLHINDYKEAVQCVEEMEQAPQLSVFVRVGVEATLERSQVTRDHMGQFFHLLLHKDVLPREQLYRGFGETLEMADDMAIDIPHIWLYLAQLLGPLLKEGGISMRELFSELSKPLLPVGRAGILFAEILHLLCKQMSHRKVGSLWTDSGLNWSDFLPEGEDVHTFISEQKLQFTQPDSQSPPPLLSRTPLSPEELSRHLERLLLEDMASDEQIFDWVEANLDESQMSSSPFLRSLMTAVCKAAVKDESSSCRVDTAIIQKRLPVLLKYLNSDTERQLQALYALQALIVTLDQPPNLLRMFFDCLYDEDVISEDAFYLWESSKDPAEQQGKGVALKSVTAFFTWLREAEEESEDN
ncbi:eukaryotic translation initiation factor 4 gamma 3 isoform X3 [Alosa pseudoharengus]|uniref:eukaryotic translation initiation factor 4 gamma 3 isoform X3 n=1 Tax=Alosa pseudoharengus TaxID=34774 RepID=UPI003F8A2380